MNSFAPFKICITKENVKNLQDLLHKNIILYYPFKAISNPNITRWFFTNFEEYIPLNQHFEVHS